MYPEVWRGISVEYRASEGSIVKSTYTVAPGADATQIRLRYNVPVEVQSDGSLRFAFERGDISESAPIAWQDIDGARVPVPVAFQLFETANANLQSEIENLKSEVGFHLGAYDARYPLTIDPNYVWHTFYGSTSDDFGYSIAIDGNGNVYVTGYSWTTWRGDGDVYPIHAHSGGSDIFVLKLNSTGDYLWHAYYGSSYEADYGRSIAVDGSGNVYVTGYSFVTWQGDKDANPIHAHSGGNDIFVLKLNSMGEYQWHTFYGSSRADQGHDIAVDGSGNVYVTGTCDATWQGDGGANPLHPYNRYEDIVVLKLTSAGAYQWHTFYGSSMDDYGRGIAVDGSSKVYVTGYSYATWKGDGGANPLHPYKMYNDIVVLKLSGIPTAVTLSSFRATTPTFDLAAWFAEILRAWAR